MIPFQDSPQGSPPFDFQLESCEGLFSEAYKTWRACTADYKSQATTKPEHLSNKNQDSIFILSRFNKKSLNVKLVLALKLIKYKQDAKKGQEIILSYQIKQFKFICMRSHIIITKNPSHIIFSTKIKNPFFGTNSSILTCIDSETQQKGE